MRSLMIHRKWTIRLRFVTMKLRKSCTQLQKFKRKVPDIHRFNIPDIQESSRRHVGNKKPGSFENERNNKVGQPGYIWKEHARIYQEVARLDIWTSLELRSTEETILISCENVEFLREHEQQSRKLRLRKTQRLGKLPESGSKVSDGSTTTRRRRGKLQVSQTPSQHV